MSYESKVLDLLNQAKHESEFLELYWDWFNLASYERRGEYEGKLRFVYLFIKDKSNVCKEAKETLIKVIFDTYLL
jgi:hypothetical protein